MTLPGWHQPEIATDSDPRIASQCLYISARIRSDG